MALKSASVTADDTRARMRCASRGSVVVADGDAGEHRAVAVDGAATITREPSEDLLAAWEARHGSRAKWAAAWFEIQLTRLISYSANKAP